MVWVELLWLVILKHINKWLRLQFTSKLNLALERLQASRRDDFNPCDCSVTAAWSAMGRNVNVHVAAALCSWEETHKHLQRRTHINFRSSSQEKEQTKQAAPRRIKPAHEGKQPIRDQVLGSFFRKIPFIWKCDCSICLGEKISSVSFA